MNRIRCPISTCRQNGAVLFVALIVLILLTMLGLTAAQVTVLQERMSGNFRVQQLAFENAEGAMSAGRDKASDYLTAYDTIPDEPKELDADSNSPWDSWLTTPAVGKTEVAVRACGSACPQRLGSRPDDPNRHPRYYVITAQQKDLAASADETAAWSTVQTVYVY